MNPSLPSAIAPGDFAAHYERLRGAALGRTSSGNEGLTLLLRQGLAAWIRAYCCGAVSPVRDPVPPPNSVHLLLTDVRSQAAAILAAIILHSRPEAVL